MVLKLHDLPYYIEWMGYLGIFFFFLTVDQVTPFPEEISLLVIGYFASKGVFNPVLAGLVALASFLTVDTIYYFLATTGKRWGKRLLERRSDSFIATIKEKFTSNFPKALLVLCFIPRVRMWAPLVSGLLQIPYTRFIKYDALYLAVFTAIYIALGEFFHKGLGAFITELESAQNIIFFSVILLATIVILVLIRRHKHGS